MEAFIASIQMRSIEQSSHKFIQQILKMFTFFFISCFVKLTYLLTHSLTHSLTHFMA